MKKTASISAKEKPAWLPGDGAPARFLDRLMRVDCAGEYGATRIYGAQIDILGDGSRGKELRHMAAQEDVHYEYFSKNLPERGARPSLLSPFWRISGRALGLGSGLLGNRAAMACSVAVEDEIDAHYMKQIKRLRKQGDENALLRKIERFREEELEHKQIGLDCEAEAAIAYPLLRGAISLGAKICVKLAEKF